MEDSRKVLQLPRMMSRQSAPSSFLTIPKLGIGILVAAVNFAMLGTIAALWKNPFFIRMTPVGNWEIFTWLLISLLAGLFMVVRRPTCSVRSAGAGGILGFLGIACPICNKLLVLAFGAEFLLAHFEPFRLYVALAGALVLAAITRRELALRNRTSLYHRPGNGA